MKNTNMINTIYGAVIGFASGAAGELLILNAILSKLPGRSIAVACIVTAVAWAIAGGVIAFQKTKKTVA